jgi:hypothetical protein
MTLVRSVRACCPTQVPVGLVVAPSTCARRAATSITNST